MSAEAVLEIICLFQQNAIDIIIDGGWAVDAVLGEQTRLHADLDIAIPHKDVTLARALLEQRGYHDVPRPDTRDCNFVLGDDLGHEVDFHTFTFDDLGNNIFGVPYPLASLNGQGVILGQVVKCVPPDWQVNFHTGYAVDENDYRDVKALCLRFNLPLPVDYARFEPQTALAAIQADRDALFVRILETLRADHRFIAAWLTGSLGRGDEDALSDLDIYAVIADEHSAGLCAHPEMVTISPAEDRLAFFQSIGQTALIYENHHNAPPGGTASSVLYRGFACYVDWTLVPQSFAVRPAAANLLFERSHIASAPVPVPLDDSDRIAKISEKTAFFWMMAAVTAKYIWRDDLVFSTSWLENLQLLYDEVNSLLQGISLAYGRGSLTHLQINQTDQSSALRQLCLNFLELKPEIERSGAAFPSDPMYIIGNQLSLIQSG